MTITYLELLTFVFAVILFMFTPGPGVFAILAKAMIQGAWSAFPMAVGMGLGDALYMVFSAYGLSAIATNFSSVFTLIKYLGAAYLFYLAWKMWITIPKEINHYEALKQGKVEGCKSLISGFLISTSNPKVILFYVSLLPSFFPVTRLNSYDIWVLCVVICLSAILAMMTYAILANVAQRRLKTSKAQQRFNRVGALLMAIAGIWLLLKG